MDMNHSLTSNIDVDNVLDEVYSAVASVCKNLKDTLGVILGSENYNFGPEVKALQQEIRTLQENITFVVARTSTNEHSAMPMTKRTNQLEIVQNQYNNLQREWENQQDHLGKLQGEIFKLRNQLKVQSSYCAALGATLGKLIWKVCKLPEAVESLLAGNKLSEFVCVTSGTLSCFVDTYSTGVPDCTTNETTFILSMIGTIANIGASPDGREFLTSDPNGKALLQQIFKIMPKIPDESGDSLQRVLMMALYNISINQKGFLMMQGETRLLQTISRYILNERSPELKLMALRLLMSLSVHITSVHILKDMLNNIPLTEIKELKNTTDAEMRAIATTIVKQFEEAESRFKKERAQPLQVYPKDCRLMKNQPCCTEEPIMEPKFNPFLAHSNN